MVGRRTPDGLTARPDDGVHQGRLARSGGTADDGEQRRIQRAQARQHVVVQLLDQLPTNVAGVGDPGDVERQTQPIDTTAELVDGDEQRVSIRLVLHEGSACRLPIS